MDGTQVEAVIAELSQWQLRDCLVLLGQPGQRDRENTLQKQQRFKR
eukprot:COSAG01_NODE_5160_length_4444_cov_3.051784_1_plen_46_part_00